MTNFLIMFSVGTGPFLHWVNMNLDLFEQQQPSVHFGEMQREKMSPCPMKRSFSSSEGDVNVKALLAKKIQKHTVDESITVDERNQSNVECSQILGSVPNQSFIPQLFTFNDPKYPINGTVHPDGSVTFTVQPKQPSQACQVEAPGDADVTEVPNKGRGKKTQPRKRGNSSVGRGRAKGKEASAPKKVGRPRRNATKKNAK